jgi:cobalt-zinc-cadmium efflux system outer membrane protein
MFSLRTALFGAACVYLCAASEASAVTLDHAPLAVRDRIHTLWTDNPAIQAADAQRRAAEARVRAAEQPVYNPTLSLEGENADVDRRTASASLALDLSGKRHARVDESEAALRVSEATYALRRRDIAVEWLRAWASAELARRQRSLGEERVVAMTRFDNLAADRLRVGDISAPERDLAALALAEARIEQAAIEGQVAAALASLNAIGGERGEGPGAELPALPEALPASPDRIDAQAPEDRLELQQAYAEQQRLDAAVTVARRARLSDPTVSLTGGRVRSGSRSDPVIGISVSMPLPVRNTGRAEVMAAQAEADAALAERQATAWKSEATLRQSAMTYRALRSTAEALRGARTGAPGQRAALLERLWQAGELDTSDYLVQLKQNLDTALSTLTLEAQTWQAWFDYLAAAGRLPEWIDGPAKDATP